MTAVVATAQVGNPSAAPLPGSASAPPVQRSLLQDPQQGATPRPIEVPRPPLTPRQAQPTTLPLGSPLAPIGDRLQRGSGQPLIVAPIPVPRGSIWTQVPGGLPIPSDDPLKIDAASDPVLMLARSSSPPEAFRRAIAGAVRHAPAVDEAVAQADEALASRNEASALQYPVADLSFSTFSILSRNFSGDPRNVLERSRPQGRTDAIARVQQPLIDFGATVNRIAAGNDRLRVAAAQIDDIGAQVALRAIGAWYNVFGYRALVRLGEAFAGSQTMLRDAVEDRIAQGAAAPGDLAQVDGYLASANAQLADFRRARANAEAQYRALLGSDAPATLARAPEPPAAVLAGGLTGFDPAATPAVRSARASADAAVRDARAVWADQLPKVSAALDAGRYGVIETDNDYDVRASVTLSMRLGGGAKQRADQATARASAADARLRRTEQEVSRDAAVAASDLDALTEAKAALESNYLASRRARDVLAERFRVARGTLIDVLAAESNYFGVAARYVQTVTELDTARYVLLARTGQLLPELGIDAATPPPREIP